ncbi:MAG: hypothetical protein LJU34_00725 [Oscillospiraceae bacterium]|nr:hypothetical protein [Oscillospiraceae bacterium]
MKFLPQFSRFDWGAFSRDKKFVSLGSRPWTDYETGVVKGTRVEVVIWEDKTPYRRKDPSDTQSNRFEKLTFNAAKTGVVPGDVEVVPVNAVATIYGDRRDQLSIVCDDVKVIDTKTGENK